MPYRIQINVSFKNFAFRTMILGGLLLQTKAEKKAKETISKLLIEIIKPLKARKAYFTYRSHSIISNYSDFK